MSIPASAIVNVIPGVLSAGGNPLALNGLILSIAAVLPFGTPVAFADAATVSTYFGPTSQEYAMAQTYFAGFNNSTLKPTSLYFARYAKTAQSAFLRGAANTLTLAQIQAIIPGVSTTSATIAGTTLTIGAVSSGAFVPGMLLTGSGVTSGTRIVSQLTGATGGAGTYLVDTSQTVTPAIAITGAYDLTIVLDGVSHTAASVNLSAATSFDDAAARVATAYANSIVGTYASNFASYVFTSPTTGATSTIGYGSGALATALGLTSALGAVTSQGSAISVPSSVMDAILLTTSNWLAFTHAFEPDASSTAYTVKRGFATWASASNGRFLYVANDANANLVAANGTTVNTLSAWATANSISGTSDIYCDATSDPNGLGAAGVLGSIASIDFNATNGRVVLHGKSISGVPTSVTDLTKFNNLKDNKASAYCSFATANNIFNFFANGYVSGAEGFIDNYVNAAFLNSQLQLALMTLIANTTSIPVNAVGGQIIRHGCQPPIDQMKNFGGIRTGVALSASQVAAVNAAAGAKVDGVLFDQGYFLKVPIPSAQIRTARGPWPLTLWYTNGEGIQTLTLASINVR